MPNAAYIGSQDIAGMKWVWGISWRTQKKAWTALHYSYDSAD